MADRNIICVLFAAMLVCGCDGSGRENRPAYPLKGLSGRLVFQKGEGIRSEIYTMDFPDGRLTQLTRNDVLDEYPRWSHDGKEIAFYSDRDGTRQIYIMNAGGSNIRKITGAFPINEDPSWAPDGKRICFWAASGKGALENLFVIDTDGWGLTNITHTRKGSRRVPAWSPDGSKIAFTSDMFLSHQIYVMDAGGGEPKRLTTSPRGACRQRWSPDGKRIAYSDGGYGLKKNKDIWEMDPDGDNKKRLTDDPGHDYDPAYAPDGRKIIFSSNRTGRYELYMMDKDGANQIRLTDWKDYARYPDWTRWGM